MTLIIYLSLIILSLSLIAFASLFHLVGILMGLTMSIVSMLVYMNSLSMLMGMIMLIIYLGAMMIMIGYICAIAPNKFDLTFKTNFVLVGIILILLNNSSSLSPMNYKSPMVDSVFNFLFTLWGYKIFVGLIFVLMLSLVMMNSTQKISKGSLRL